MSIAVSTARNLNLPRDFKEDKLNRAFADLRNYLIALEDRVSDIDQSKVVRVFGNYTITSETVLEYLGTGTGAVILLPAANSLPGIRSRPRVIMNSGVNAITVQANGTDKVAGSGTTTQNAGTFGIYVCNGVDTWRVK